MRFLLSILLNIIFVSYYINAQTFEPCQSYATLNPLPKSKLLVENKISLLLDLIQK